MSTFDEREEGFESKFAHDEELEFKATARRNRMLGLWAGELMGLAEANLDEYAAAIVRADVTEPNDEDVLRRVSRDLEGAGIKVTEGQVMAKMDELLAIARGQIQAGE
ncbi:MAG TPA: DUF1476 domain-containing protein [Caulobacteraceae bacterium]|nr:DUF1476 domain-containing protein [Caulobacteraceae bacterium]